MTILWVVLGAVASGILTGAVRTYAIGKSVLDIPNHRSSHTVPTPRGGGVAIAVVVLAGTVLGWAADAVPRDFAVALIGGGAAVALTGWLDDRFRLSAAVRAAVHLVAAGWVILRLGGLPELDLGVTRVPLGAFGTVVGMLGAAWMINLYNFMDGIDGLAAGEGVLVGIIGGVLLTMSGEPGLALVALLTAAACAGFLWWNWHPARIFMGDVGSGFLGIVFATLAVASENRSAVPLLLWVVLLGVFIFDATVTLVRRVLRRERWYEAHRSHAYQRAVQAGRSHHVVTAGALGVGLLLGIGVWVAHLWRDSIPIVVLACLSLLTWIYFRIEKARPMEPEPSGSPSAVEQGVDSGLVGTPADRSRASRHHITRY